MANHPSGARWHRCAVWLRLGMSCPFTGGEDDEIDAGDPPDDVPRVGVPADQVPPLVLLAARQARGGGVLAQAEAVVAEAAESIPVGVGSATRSLADSLGVPGIVGVGAGAAAAFAVRQVAKRIQARGGGGGLHFPSVLDPARAFRVP